MSLLFIVLGIIALGIVATYYLGSTGNSISEMRSNARDPKRSIDSRDEAFTRFTEAQLLDAMNTEREESLKEKEVKKEKKYDVEL